jgi:putative ABC transport system permease protein
MARSDLEDGWDPIPLVVRNVEDGSEVELRIIGVIEPQVTAILQPFWAIFVNQAVIEESFGGGNSENFFVTTVAGGDEAADDVAKGIEAALLERGVQGESIRSLIDEQSAFSNGFQMLFEGFMGLGLIVGIAALGVIAFRTVVERRQQIGMLRAIGYSRRLVGLSFFFESSFIALTGIAMGLLLGGALSYNLLTSPEFTEGAELDVRVPWLRLALISGIAYVASALMTLIPARSASRVAAAEALRYSG